MNYEYIIVILFVIILIFYNYCYTSNKSNKQIENLDLNNLFEINNMNKKNKTHVVILFYSKKCKYSMDFIPIWNSIKKGKSDTLEFLDLEVNNLDIKKMVNEMFITTTPTLICFKTNNFKNLKKDINRNVYNLKEYILDYKVYKGKYDLKLTIKWLKSNGIFLKESYIEQFTNNNFKYDVKDDYEIRYGTSGNRCNNKSTLNVKPLHDDCYHATFYKKSDNIYCIDSKYQKGCINPREVDLKPINGAYNVVASYLDSINLDNYDENQREEIIKKCANTYKGDLNEFGLCDNQQFLSDLKKYDNYTKRGLVSETCKDTNYNKNSLFSDSIIDACRNYKRGR